MRPRGVVGRAGRRGAAALTLDALGADLKNIQILRECDHQTLHFMAFCCQSDKVVFPSDASKSTYCSPQALKTDRSTHPNASLGGFGRVVGAQAAGVIRVVTLATLQQLQLGKTKRNQTRLSSRQSAAGSVHRQDSTCPNPPMPQSAMCPRYR